MSLDKDNLNCLVQVDKPVIGGYFLNNEDTEGFEIGKLYQIIGAADESNTCGVDTPFWLCAEGDEFYVVDDDGDKRYMRVYCDVWEQGGKLYVQGDK